VAKNIGGMYFPPLAGFTELTRVSMLSNDKFYVIAYNTAAPDFKRRESNGNLDLGFMPTYSTGFGTAADVFVQPADQKVVVLASAVEIGGLHGYTLVRFLP
jgi:hypothetical protein